MKYLDKHMTLNLMLSSKNDAGNHLVRPEAISLDHEDIVFGKT
jgi:hypothetical protein